MMKLLLNDYGGYSFPIQLSRELSRNQYVVMHTYCNSIQSPRGELKKRTDDPIDLSIHGIKLSSNITKDAFLKRRQLEIEYGTKLTLIIDSFKPDCIIVSNTPLDAQIIIWKFCKTKNIPIVYWLQDVQGIAIRNILTKKYFIFGNLIGSYYTRKEKEMLNQCSHIVTISDSFTDLLISFSISRSKITFIPNWAPIDALPIRGKVNEWSKYLNISEKKIVLYSGTLGFKHNPFLLEKLSIALMAKEDTYLVVISEGLGQTYLQEAKLKKGLTNLILLPFQEFDQLPNILASADVLIAILEKDASTYSVPSKVLTYLCSGKPIVLSLPPNNLSAEIVEQSSAGFVASPSEENLFINHIFKLLDDSNLSEQLGKNGRFYAEKHFNIVNIGRRFMNILNTINSLKRS